MASLNGKSIVIIGGTSGIGFAILEAALKAGARAVATGIDSNRKPCDELEKNYPVHFLYGDVSEENHAEKGIELLLTRSSRLDGLVHVAGGSGRARGDGTADQFTDDGIDYTLELNLKSAMRSNRAAIRVMLEQGCGGSIVNIGSVLAFSPSPTYFATHAYAAAKGGLHAFSKSIAAYYAVHGIRVNVLAPGLVQTPMAKRAAESPEIQAFIKQKQPLDGGRIGRPTDCDGAALLLLSDDSRFITGQVLAIDGGWSTVDRL